MHICPNRSRSIYACAVSRNFIGSLNVRCPGNPRKRTYAYAYAFIGVSVSFRHQLEEVFSDRKAVLFELRLSIKSLLTKISSWESNCATFFSVNDPYLDKHLYTKR